MLINGSYTNCEEIEKRCYSFDEIFEMLKKPFLESSKVINREISDNLFDSNYSIFLKEYGNQRQNNFQPGEKFLFGNEYRFVTKKNEPSGIRFFRDKKQTIKIVCLYFSPKVIDPNWLDWIFEGSPGKLIIDKLTAQGGYMIFLNDRSEPDFPYDRHQYRLVSKLGNNYFYADISSEIVSKNQGGSRGSKKKPKNKSIRNPLYLQR